MSPPGGCEKTFGKSHTNTRAKKYRNYLPVDITTAGPIHQAFVGPGTNTTELQCFVRDLVPQGSPRLSMTVEDCVLDTQEMTNIEQSISSRITEFELRLINSSTEFQCSLVKTRIRQTRPSPFLHSFTQCSFNLRRLDRTTTVQICGFTDLRALAIMSLDDIDILVETEKRSAAREKLLQILVQHHHTLTTFHMTLDLLEDLEHIFFYLKLIPTLRDLVLGKAGQLDLRRGLTITSQQKVTRGFTGLSQLVSLSVPIEITYPELLDILAAFPELQKLTILSFCNNLVGASLLKIIARSMVMPGHTFMSLKVLDVGRQSSDEVSIQELQLWFPYSNIC